MSNFHVLCETNMSTMLSGNLFIDTKFNADLLKKNDFLDADARGHVNGLVKVFGLKEKDIKNLLLEKKRVAHIVVNGDTLWSIANSRRYCRHI